MLLFFNLLYSIIVLSFVNGCVINITFNFLPSSVYIFKNGRLTSGISFGLLFFILYNFAKTRRCVEAAYLMFF